MVGTEAVSQVLTARRVSDEHSVELVVAGNDFGTKLVGLVVAELGTVEIVT